MDVRPLPAEEPAVRQFVETTWLPYRRELAATVDAPGLADDVDAVSQEVEYRLERLEEPETRTWVAVAGERDRGQAVADADLAGFVTTDVDEAPPVFDRPDRLIVGDLYVREPERGSGLARELIERARERARMTGCGQLALDVDRGNERALAFYRKFGFETSRHRMTVGVDEMG